MVIFAFVFVVPRKHANHEFSALAIRAFFVPSDQRLLGLEVLQPPLLRWFDKRTIVLLMPANYPPPHVDQFCSFKTAGASHPSRAPDMG
jgi:hypothetical protein